ncbi:ATP-dependent DNA helicase MER3 [Penicillium rolfsii]|nr:ATP-dependent DNA helicase MER3 [Penicillium rolfsii]
MDTRNTLNPSRHSDPSPKRRRFDPESAFSYQTSRPGFIDQRLMEGSQWPGYPDLVQRVTPSIQKSTSMYHDEDVQLDAFGKHGLSMVQLVVKISADVHPDLELLAQQKNISTFQSSSSAFQHPTPEVKVSTGLKDQDVPPLKSRFFESLSHATPFSGPASSQSDLASGPSSSPLMMMHQRKEPTWRSQGQLKPGADSQKHEAIPQSPEQSYAPFVNIATPASGHRNEGSPPFGHLPPSVRGIILVSVNDLPEKYRSMYPFTLFNAIQSKCFHPVYNSNDNIVLAAPTGSGKTVVMELAICRLLNALKDERFKVVYQAPTKSLCSERFRDWNTKFAALDLKCAELTGDTDHTQLRSIQSSQIIITTPEKWDSMTRKWKDHMRLMQLVKLFLIDEVHILKETRGATLEAVVSRMKTIGSNVRFVALSATVPNSEDIATWLGKDSTNQHVPAHREHFGEDFRPVQLQKFVYGYQSTGNDFAFDKVCGSNSPIADNGFRRLPEVIGTHSCHKPIMIFCCTRNSSVATAKDLAKLWNMTNPPARLWKAPKKWIEASNDDLKTTITAGVAFHHAGLSATDRHMVEKGFLEGQINVICCTSTLAVGVNLPCHLVIIKNTVSWQDGGCKEYSDLEMMQMLGRAGRPQFDDSATAVIITRKERVAHYERLVSGSKSLESCLHLNLIEHLNAEIGLGNVTDVQSAIKWLASTFLFVRLRRNPTHYKLKEGASEDDEDELLRQICEKDIKLLQEFGLVENEKLGLTLFGDAMARYYIQFETMKKLLSLTAQADLPQILDAIIQAEEFHEVRVKAGEKSLYREINKDPGIRYPIKADIALPTHKISLILQFELGALDFPTSDQLQKHKFAFQQDKSLVFAHVNRLIRCVIDCFIAREDSVAARNALELARSFGAKVWDRSPLQMKQIEQIGVVAVRKLAAAVITDIEELEATEASRIDMILSKNPPFGLKLLGRMKEFPKLRVTMKVLATEAKKGNVKVRFKIDVAFMNDKIPSFFQRKPVYVCCLTETSDGRLVDFRRLRLVSTVCLVFIMLTISSANKLQDGIDITLITDIRSTDQYLVCNVMCDGIGAIEKPTLSGARGSIWDIPTSPPKPDAISDAFDGDDLKADDFLVVETGPSKLKKPTESLGLPFDDLDWLSIDENSSNSQGATEKLQRQGNNWTTEIEQQDNDDAGIEPVRLPNGNWACSHKCKNKTRQSCKHLCCRDGLENHSKPRKPKKRAISNHKAGNFNQLKLSASTKKRDTSVDVSKGKQPAKQLPKLTVASQEFAASQSKLPKSPLQVSTSHRKEQGAKGIKKQPGSETDGRKPDEQRKTVSSDFEDDDMDDLPPLSTFMQGLGSATIPTAPTGGDASQRGDSVFVDPLFEIEQTFERPQPENPRSMQTDEPREIIEISDDSSPGPGKDIFTNPENTARSSVTAPLSASSTSIISTQVPESSTCSRACGTDILERIETGRLPNLLLPPLPVRHTLTYLEPMSAVDLISNDGIHRTPTTSSSGWDDIDRLLLEEWKDATNHY